MLNSATGISRLRCYWNVANSNELTGISMASYVIPDTMHDGMIAAAHLLGGDCE
jgi:hypothetical protein